MIDLYLTLGHHDEGLVNHKGGYDYAYNNGGACATLAEDGRIVRGTPAVPACATATGRCLKGTMGLQAQHKEFIAPPGTLGQSCCVHSISTVDAASALLLPPNSTPEIH